MPSFIHKLFFSTSLPSHHFVFSVFRVSFAYRLTDLIQDGIFISIILLFQFVRSLLYLIVLPIFYWIDIRQIFIWNLSFCICSTFIYSFLYMWSFGIGFLFSSPILLQADVSEIFYFQMVSCFPIKFYYSPSYTVFLYRTHTRMYIYKLLSC